MLERIVQRILQGGSVSWTESLELLALSDRRELYEAAHTVTEYRMGRHFDTCSIISAKGGGCPEDCKWCAQSVRYATGARHHALVDASMAIERASSDRKQGIGRFSLVASGRRMSEPEVRQVAEIYRGIKRANPDLRCCASLGLLDEGAMRILFESGVTTYHCNMETAPSYFPALCTTHTQSDKEETLSAARRLGMRVCCGGIIGMGETAEQRLELAFYLRRLGSKSIPINILQPIAGTPLADTPPLSEDEILTAVALFRLVNPDAYLRFSGGRMQLSQIVQQRAIYVGINAAITGDFLTTSGQQVAEDMRMIAACGKLNGGRDWEVAYDY